MLLKLNLSLFTSVETYLSVYTLTSIIIQEYDLINRQVTKSICFCTVHLYVLFHFEYRQY